MRTTSNMEFLNSTLDNHSDSYENTSNTQDVEFVYPEFDRSVKNVLVAITLILIDIITICGNLLVLISFYIDSRLLNPFNLFILNLAFTDFLVAITAMVFYTIDTLLGYWPFGYIMCSVWIYFDFGMTFASVFTVVAISIDRFWSVSWAIHYRMNNNRTKSVTILVIIWFGVIAIWTPPFVFDRRRHSEEYSCIWKPSDNTEFVIFVALIGHYVPCIVMVFCYVKVFLVMRHQAELVAPNFPSTSSVNYTRHLPSDPSLNSCGLNQPTLIAYDLTTYDSTKINQLKIDSPLSDKKHNCNIIPLTSIGTSDNFESTTGAKFSRNTVTSSHHTSSHNREKRIFVTLTYVVGCYLICWFPFYIVFDTYAWKPELVPDGLYTFFFWMTYINSTLNPFIYVFTNKDFRKAFVKVVKCVHLCRCAN